GKQTACVEIFSAIVTLKTGKPAKIIYDRKETFNCSTSRHAMRCVPINTHINTIKNLKEQGYRLNAHLGLMDKDSIVELCKYLDIV
ncbi:hypothetical protein ACTPEF_23520, partial [Clostridioides difficile]